MRNRDLIIWMTLIGLLLFTRSVSAETGFGSGFAAVRGGDLVLNTGGDTYAIVTNPPNHGVFSLAWSPDGSQLAYILYDTDFQARLLVVDAEGGEPISLAAGNLEAGFPVTFMPDGDILYAQSTYDPANPVMDNYQANLNRIAPVAGASPEVLGSISYGTGCGGGSPLPADWQYWGESGFGGGYITLQWTDYGILHSINCGGTGLALFDPAADTERYLMPTTLGPNGIPQTDVNIGRAALSADGSTIAAIKTVYAEPDPIESLVFLDLATGALTEQTTVGEPEQLTWANDGTLYYSTRNSDYSITDALTPEQRQFFDQNSGGSGFSVDAYQVHIRHLNPATGEDNEVYTAAAYQVGRLRAAADGSLWFSLVANQDDWVAAIVSGQLDPMTDSDGLQQRALVPVSVYRLQSGQPVERVGENLNQFTLRPPTS